MVEEIILVEPVELQRLIHEELQRFFEILKTANPATNEWLDSKDVPTYLKVSKKTYYEYRKRRLIPFSQVGRKIMVRKSDLDAFLEAFRVNPIVEFKTGGHGKS